MTPSLRDEQPRCCRAYGRACAFLDTDRQDALVVLVDGDYRGLANDDALAAHGDKRICGAEVDGKIARIATEEHIHQRKQRNS